MREVIEILITVFIMQALGIYLKVHPLVDGFVASIFLLVFSVGVISIISMVMSLIDFENKLQEERDNQ